MMASARDLITLFVALETISIPTFILAAFRKHDRVSNEAGVKYYLIGVLSSALMLYGMSLIFGVTGSTKLVDDRLLRRGARHDVVADRRGVPLADRFRVQDQCGALPLLGARHLRRRADPGHGVPLGRVEGGRFRRADQHHLLRLLREQRQRRARVVGRGVGARRALDDVRQPRRAAADEHRAHARVLVDRAGRVHARAVRGRRYRRCRRQDRRRRGVDERGRDLPLDLRRDEPRCVRGRDRGRAPHEERGDLVVLGACSRRRRCSRSR